MRKTAARSIADTKPKARIKQEKKDIPGLLSILFSDTHCNDFAMLGAAATQWSLDDGSASQKNGFWHAIQANFVMPGLVECDNLLFHWILR